MPMTVQRLMRTRVTPQKSRYMYGHPWVVDGVTPSGIDIYYGARRYPASIPWTVLERIPVLLADRGWVEVEGSPEDASSLAALTGNELPPEWLPYVAGLLEMGGIVNVHEGPPMRMRLRPRSKAQFFPSDVTRAGDVPERGIDEPVAAQG